MKKYVCRLVALILSLTMVCGCAKQSLPLPAYPADAAAIANALQEAELPWTIVKEEAWPYGRTIFTLHNESDKLVAFVLTGMWEGRRMLDISCMPYFDGKTIAHFLPEEEWEKVIVFATLLYGGFNSQAQVYELFAKEFDTENTITTQHVTAARSGEVSAWQRQINGIYCLVKLERPYDTLPSRYLNTVRLDNTDEGMLRVEKAEEETSAE